jgi:hypothetical protein
MTVRDGELLAYAGAIAALQSLVGKRVVAHISWYSGPTVAEIGVGYLQPPSQFGHRREDETTLYLITETPEPERGYHQPLWPYIKIHDVPDFAAWTNGARVECSFQGVVVTVELADPEEWRQAERAYEAGRSLTSR